MTPERVLTVCVGISAYDRRLLAPGEKPLGFLALGAAELSAIFSSAWTSDKSRHLTLVDGEGTWSGVRSVIAAEKLTYDLFVLYLGGHGRIQEGNFQFLFAADAASPHLASSDALDEIAGLADARHVLVLVDACHSGRYIEETSFFDPSQPTAHGCALLLACPTRAVGRIPTSSDPSLSKPSSMH